MKTMSKVFLFIFIFMFILQSHIYTDTKNSPKIERSLALYIDVLNQIHEKPIVRTSPPLGDRLHKLLKTPPSPEHHKLWMEFGPGEGHTLVELHHKWKIQEVIGLGFSDPAPQLQINTGDGQNLSYIEQRIPLKFIKILLPFKPIEKTYSNKADVILDIKGVLRWAEQFTPQIEDILNFELNILRPNGMLWLRTGPMIFLNKEDNFIPFKLNKGQMVVTVGSIPKDSICQKSKACQKRIRDIWKKFRLSETKDPLIYNIHIRKQGTESHITFLGKREMYFNAHPPLGVYDIQE